MNNVNKTLFIPLYGKAKVSKQGVIISDPTAEKIWETEKFPIRGKSKSKWLTYNMAMRARVFDDWTDNMLSQNKTALVIQIGCGLDSRCRRVKENYNQWIDIDFPDVISVRKRYFDDSPNYSMIGFDASDSNNFNVLPDADCAIVILEGVSMYMSDRQSNRQLREMFGVLECKYNDIHVLVDVYTEFAAKASKYKNPVNDVGVTELFGVDNMDQLLEGLRLHVVSEHSMTPARLVNELGGFDRAFFSFMFAERLYRKFYRLYELETK